MSLPVSSGSLGCSIANLLVQNGARPLALISQSEASSARARGFLDNLVCQGVDARTLSCRSKRSGGDGQACSSSFQLLATSPAIGSSGLRQEYEDATDASADNDTEDCPLPPPSQQITLHRDLSLQSLQTIAVALMTQLVRALVL
jgi:hypothetical protein